jgi:cytokinin dehydrogenase
MKHKIKKFLKNNFLTSGLFSPQELNQTDFGRIYFNLPEETVFPKTTEELAKVLKHYNDSNKAVTIRNTGHSVNGQTLTSGVQVNVGKIKKLYFNKDEMLVTAGAGNSWDDVFKFIGFPKYCLPVFPSNPGQQIHVTGTASVGGIGPYSSRSGGLWNHVVAAKVVTMTGDIIVCSIEKNFEVLQYVLGGFGRIGVISEITIKVEESKQKMIVNFLAYKDYGTYFRDLNIAMQNGAHDGVVGNHDVNYKKTLSKIGLQFYGIVVADEIRSEKDAIEKQLFLNKTLSPDLHFYIEKGQTKDVNVEISLSPQVFSKKDFIYYYPKFSKSNQLDLCHPWSDYVIGKKQHQTFLKEVNSLLEKYDMAQYVAKQSVLHNSINIDVLLSYCVRNISAVTGRKYPLSLDLNNKDDFVFDVAFVPTIPSEKVKQSIAMNEEITDLVYELGGKKYLYSQHNLSRHQVEQHFGREVLERWQQLKDKYDPKRLLNIGVIEHLD